ncbi:penicillin-binding protein activator LpoB [bacterium]|nr:penicillin-binding protein activator LpoB [bacterium]
MTITIRQNLNKNGLVHIFCFLILFSLLSGCSSVKVSRATEDEPTDLSGAWNDTDSRLVSEHMINDLLHHGWMNEFRFKHDRNPVITIGKILNKTTEHIATQTFTNDIELALIRSNRVDLTASGKARTEVRKEKEDYQTHSQHPAGTRITVETQADFILRGEIHSVEDQLKDTKVVTYQIDLELLTLENNEKIWISQKKIKKIIEKPTLGW